MKTNHPVQPRRREVLLAGAAGFALGVLPFAARTASGADVALKIGTVGSGRIGSTLMTPYLAFVQNLGKCFMAQRRLSGWVLHA